MRGQGAYAVSIRNSRRTRVFATGKTFLTDTAGGINVAETNNVVSDRSMLVDAYDWKCFLLLLQDYYITPNPLDYPDASMAEIADWVLMIYVQAG